MVRKWHRIFTILSILTLGFLFFGAPEPVNAQTAGTAAEVMAEINGLRAANGLAPLVENVYLTIAAQNHADWIAVTGQGGHTGEGGSSAKDRALAVGYGEGAQVWVTENWARGSGLTAYGCVYNMWYPSTDHINNMLTTSHYEFGAGVSLDGSGFTVYVVKFGRVDGSVPVQSTVPSSGATGPIVQQIKTATPGPDGSVIHVVQYGQTLWTIADAYEVPLADILALNFLTEDSAIYPDEELLIIEGTGETVEATATPEAVTPTPTPSPTKTPAATPDEITPTPVEEPNPRGNFLRNIFSGDTLWVGIGLVVVSIFGIALLLFTSSRLR